jgi:hypothetical protein
MRCAAGPHIVHHVISKMQMSVRRASPRCSTFRLDAKEPRNCLDYGARGLRTTVTAAAGIAMPCQSDCIGLRPRLVSCGCDNATLASSLNNITIYRAFGVHSKMSVDGASKTEMKAVESPLK